MSFSMKIKFNTLFLKKFKIEKNKEKNTLKKYIVYNLHTIKAQLLYP